MRALPAALHAAVAAHAAGARVVAVQPVGGGCISTVLQVQLSTGDVVFVKLAPAEPPGDALLEAEAHALAALRATATVRVPAEVARGAGWLMLEWLAPGPGSAAAWAALGRSLARLHGHRAARFGFDRDNFIGTLPQANPPAEDWAAFWWTARLEPQLARAGSRLDPELRRGFARLRAALPELLAPGQREGASLLHGDLWGGNVQMVAEGEPAIIDPASYRGHREVDLAMATLFGGFAPEFFRAYEAECPLEAAGLQPRRAAYQLYYLLVHVNLFGTSYVPQVRAALGAALQGQPAF